MKNKEALGIAIIPTLAFAVFMLFSLMTLVDFGAKRNLIQKFTAFIYDTPFNFIIHKLGFVDEDLAMFDLMFWSIIVFYFSFILIKKISNPT